MEFAAPINSIHCSLGPYAFITQLFLISLPASGAGLQLMLLVQVRNLDIQKPLKICLVRRKGGGREISFALQTSKKYCNVPKVYEYMSTFVYQSMSSFAHNL